MEVFYTYFGMVLPYWDGFIPFNKPSILGWFTGAISGGFGGLFTAIPSLCFCWACF